VIVGPKTGRLANTFGNTLIFLLMGAYMLSMDGADTSRTWCTPIAGLFAACILLLPIQLRTLGNIVLVGVMGFVTIAVVVITPLAWLIMYGPDQALINSTAQAPAQFPNTTGLVMNSTSERGPAKDTQFYQSFDAIGGFLFAFGGQSICKIFSSLTCHPSLFPLHCPSRMPCQTSVPLPVSFRCRANTHSICTAPSYQTPRTQR